MKKHQLKLIAALLAFALLLSACGAQTEAGPNDGAEEPEEAGELQGQRYTERQPADRVFSLNYDPEGSMNPIRAESAANMQFWSLLYDCVFYQDQNFELGSEIVTGYTTDDYIWWVFKVRTDLCFSDGEPLTARDVAYSIQTARNTGYYGGRLGLIYGISAMDEETFAITTAYADSALPALLTVPIIKRGDYYEDFPLGSGPYVLNESHTALVRNPLGRHGAEMPLDTIYLKDYTDISTRITAFEESRIDIVTNDPTGMYNLGYGSSNETRYFDTTNLHFIGFNLLSKYFSNLRTRAAMAFAIDREYIAGTLMGTDCGVAAVQPVHPKTPLYNSAYAGDYAYNPKRAEALFRSVIDDLDDDGDLEMLVTGIVVELNIKFIVNNDSSAKIAAARHITDGLNAMGITTQLYELSWEDYIEALEKGDYDMYYGEVRLGADWDMSYLFEVPGINERLKEEWGQNYFRTQDTTYTELYADFLAAPETERYERFQALSKYIMDTAILLPVCFERRQVLTHRGVISGLTATQFDLFYNIKDWSVNLN